CVVEVPEARRDLGFAVEFEAGARNYVEHAVGSLAELRGVPACLHFENIHIARVELRAHVRGDVGVGNGNAVNGPSDLMAAAQVKQVVRDHGTRNVIGDHGHAVGEVGAGGAGNLLAFDQRD